MMFHPDLCEAVATALKHRTIEAHQELESLLIPKLHVVHTKVEYAQLLATFYGYFAPVEKLIGQFITPEHLPDIIQRRKAAYLLNDLARLDVRSESLSLSTYLPQIENEAQAWGALYVLEGSTLGGRGITKMLLKQCPQLTVDELSFFNGYREATGPMWTSFQKTLNDLGYTSQELSIIVGSANDTFLKFKQWIQQSMA